MSERSSPESTREKKRARKSGGCYHCSSSLHRAKQCPNATCRICGETGHDAGGCAKRPLSPVDLGAFKSTNDTSGGGFKYLELFAGMGGFRVALDRLKGKCVFASELDRFCVKNYQTNFGDRPAGDICKINTDQIPNHDLLVGGFPCQPFSSSGSGLGVNDPKGRGILFREIVRILKEKQPKAFLLENVRGLFLHEDGKTLKLVVKELEESGYVVKYEMLDAVKLLPQERCRLFLVGIRTDLKKEQAFQFPIIPDLKRGIQDILHHGIKEDKLTLNEHQLDKVRAQRYTKEHPEARFLSDPKTAAKTIQSSYNKYMVGSQFIPVEVGKDDKWRRFSSREVARLQGFPEDFVLCRERAIHMVGNAVAPPIIAMIAAAVLEYIGLGCGDKDIHDWGWGVTKTLLLAASPDDSRREALKYTLSKVIGNEFQ
jgi:DNA (cytosine-5)-methyltransferase 1